MKFDLIDVVVRIHAETPRAILISEDGDEISAAWIPLSQCEVEYTRDGYAVVTLPEWLAEDRGLV